MDFEILVTFLFLETTQQVTGDSLRYVGSVIWAKLSKDVKNAESIYNFKNKIRKVDFDQKITECC